MKKRIVALVASLAVIAGLMASQGSYAWFVTAVKRAQNITILLPLLKFPATMILVKVTQRAISFSTGSK